MRSFYRHKVLVRATHWLNAGFALALLMSGLQIFNAHPALYIGKASDFDRPVLAIGAAGDPPRGETNAFGHSFATTGWLGVFTTADGQPQARAFPVWATLPGPQSLAEGRRWHFLFALTLIANGVVYWLYGLISRHIWRDLTPSRADLAALPESALAHLQLQFAHEARYNPWQKLTYLWVVVLLFPLIVFTGLTMSPRIDAEWPWLVDLFGGRQTARTLHFLAALALVGFVVLHLVMVALSGLWNNLRSMVTGRHVVTESGHEA